MQLSLPHSFPEYLLAFFIVFTVIMVRYFVIAGFFYLIFHRSDKWRSRKVSVANYSSKQFQKEIGWSLITGFIFAGAAVGTLFLFQHGYTKIYLSADAYGLWWLPFSLLLSMFIHETYYYWLHRWMHRPKVFRVLHRVHHDSHITSPWTAFSFHPLEGFFQAIILPMTLMIVPMHPYVLLVQLTIMTFSGVINHLNIEIYPADFEKHFLGRWLIGATHHSLHHKQFKYNFGLYFTFWDKWVRTESPRYKTLFKERTQTTNGTSKA